MPRNERVDLIKKIEAKRNSKVLTYICSDRHGATAQIGDDAVRPIYSQVRKLGPNSKIDLYIYSRGGAVEVPWRIISLLREHTKKLGIMVPYKAHSAATLIAIGCDEIVMGSKSELGPIDPALNRIHQEGGAPLQEEIRVEDIMAYVDFLRDKAGLGDQDALASNVRILADKLSPWVLGSIYRTHSHIRAVARKLLGSHSERIEEQRMNQIIEALAEKTYSHGHAIGRKEAQELGLPVTKPEAEVENLMWELFESYEKLMEMNKPIDPANLIDPNNDETELGVIMALTESEKESWAFKGKLRLRQIRQSPGQFNISNNFNISLPQGVDPRQIPQEVINQLQQQLQNDVPRLVNEQVRKQSPVLRVDGRMIGACWQNITSEGI